MGLKLITAPTAEPLSLPEVKLHCRIDHYAEDTLLAILIKTAREKAEHMTGRVLITQTLELALDDFPCTEIELPVSTVQSIASIKYLDLSGAEVTLPSQNYSLDNYGIKNFICLRPGFSWPSVYSDQNAVKIQLVAGYGDAESVPSGIKSWMLLTIETLYKNRGAVVDAQNYDIPSRFYDSLLDPFRVWGF